MSENNKRCQCKACLRWFSGDEVDEHFLDLLWPTDPRYTKSAICVGCLGEMQDPAAYRYAVIRHWLNAYFPNRCAIEVAGLAPAKITAALRRELRADGEDPIKRRFPGDEELTDTEFDGEFEHAVTRVLGDRALAFITSEMMEAARGRPSSAR